MKQYPLIGISIIAIVILILVSLTNVIGYQSVQSSNTQTINEAVNQRELLFQTMVDLVNNKEIQQIILKSQMSRGIFLASEMPVLTKNQLKRMYFIGLILSKVISKSRIQSILGTYQFNSLEMQKKITTIIKKDKTLNAEITQLQTSNCDCENEKAINWTFPVLCTLLFPLFVICYIIALFYYFIFFIVVVVDYIGLALNCFWAIWVEPPENHLEL
ncbi:hypothetical protein AYK25_07605 [Thermoplasmatales archaeon SM1-50]|nr:MAG: hypothetical protein AYK25_07605 [Thermoplasmatales archaeon SM1-50]